MLGFFVIKNLNYLIWFCIFSFWDENLDLRNVNDRGVRLMIVGLDDFLVDLIFG